MANRPEPSKLLDWSIAIAVFWLAVGIHVDSWYHFRQPVESFFEPAHGLLYLGLGLSFVTIGIALVAWHRAGYPWRSALPHGYAPTVAGLVVFLLGGLGDLIKHSLFGVEEAVNALVSPTHLLIGAGLFLIGVGPIRSALERRDRPRTLVGQLPMLISAASLMELVNWGLQLAIAQAESMNAPVPFAAAPHDVLTIIMLTYYKLDLGLLSVIVESILIAGAALYFARRVRLAPGALTLLLALGMSVFGATHSNYAGQFLAIFCGSVIAGAIGDVMRLNPGDQKNVRFMLAAFLIPAAYWSVYLSVLALTMGGLWWTPDLIFGSIAYAGLCGLFVNAIAMKEDSGRAEA